MACPPCLPDYHKYMRGVDRADQLMAYYNVGRRSVKWWKRVFAYFIEASILNAFIFSKFAPGGSRYKDSLAFRLELAELLVGGFTCRKVISRTHSDRNLSRLESTASRKHLPHATSKKRDCVVCSEVRKRKGLTRAQYRHENCIICMDCNVHLCIAPSRNCFEKYHTYIEYWR